ncbi:hypothetical protein RR46_00766 [Papilio xuthus]|uniref:Uncharacterized protein n=1 Tax=Papilio xuthus TaxID=66420 RepID=A0A0N1I614_PAPXU|nr:hypothetical protein RR46_00766 [Papilio xuthus]
MSRQVHCNTRAQTAAASRQSCAYACLQSQGSRLTKGTGELRRARSRAECRDGGGARTVQGGKQAAGTPRCSTTPMDTSNTRGTADALPAFEMVISSLLIIENKYQIKQLKIRDPNRSSWIER